MEAAQTYGYADLARRAERRQDFSADTIGPYGEGDSESTLLMAEDMRPELARQGLLTAYNTEMDLSVPLIPCQCASAGSNSTSTGSLRFERRTHRAPRQVSLYGTLFEAPIKELAWLRFGQLRGSGLRMFRAGESTDPTRRSGDSLNKGLDAARHRRAIRGKPHWLPMMIRRGETVQWYLAGKIVRGYLLDSAQ